MTARGSGSTTQPRPSTSPANWSTTQQDSCWHIRALPSAPDDSLVVVCGHRSRPRLWPVLVAWLGIPNIATPGAACARYSPSTMARTTDLVFDGPVLRLGRTTYRPSIALATTTVDVHHGGGVGIGRATDGPPTDYGAGCGFARCYEPAVATEWSHAEARPAQRAEHIVQCRSPHGQGDHGVMTRAR